MDSTSSSSTSPFWQRVFGYDRPDARGEAIAFRAFELLVVAFTVKYAWEWAAYLPRLQEVVLTQGIANYLDVSFLFHPTAATVNALAITLLTLAGFLRIHRLAYLGTLVLLHLHFVARFSQGKIPHSSNVLGMILLCFALAALFFEIPRLRRRFAMGSTYVFVGLGYTSAAFCKMIGTGWAWSDGRHLWMWIHEKSIDTFSKFGVLDLNAVQELALQNYWMATAFLTIGLVSEFFAVSMALRKYRIPAVGAVLALHAGIYVIMGIVFQTTTFLLIALLLYPLAERMEAHVPERIIDRLYRFAYPRRPHASDEAAGAESA